MLVLTNRSVCITSAVEHKPCCPICKGPVTRRQLTANDCLAFILVEFVALKDAVFSDMGDFGAAALSCAHCFCCRPARGRNVVFVRRSHVRRRPVTAARPPQPDDEPRTI